MISERLLFRCPNYDDTTVKRIWYIAACYPLPILQCSGHQLDCFLRFGLHPPQLKQSALLSIPIQNFGKDNRQHDGNIVYIVQFLSAEAFDKKRQCCYNVRYEINFLSITNYLSI